MTTANPIGVRHEWGELREAIIGRQVPGAFVIPPYYDGFRWMEGRMLELSQRHAGEFLTDAAPDFDAALARQADALAELLEERGVIVHRPTPFDAQGDPGSAAPNCSVMQLFPRDAVLVVGPWMIELNLRMRDRRHERFALQHVLRDAHLAGRGHWVNMPGALDVTEADDHTSLFLEGGDTLLNGSDIYVGMSGTSSNQGGIDWLQTLLGPTYHVQTVPLRSNVLHLDCAMALLRPGLGLLCRDRLAGELPPSLAGFRWIDVTEDEATGLGTNGLILNPETIIVERRQERIIGEIRRAGMEVIALAYDAPAAVGGAFRCSHHPLVRVS
jgi:glycine amidinotransferase